MLPSFHSYIDIAILMLINESINDLIVSTLNGLIVFSSLNHIQRKASPFSLDLPSSGTQSLVDLPLSLAYSVCVHINKGNNIINELNSFLFFHSDVNCLRGLLGDVLYKQSLWAKENPVSS